MWLMSDFESLIFIELIVSTVALAVVVAVARFLTRQRKRTADGVMTGPSDVPGAP